MNIIRGDRRSSLGGTVEFLGCGYCAHGNYVTTMSIAITQVVHGSKSYIAPESLADV